MAPQLLELLLVLGHEAVAELDEVAARDRHRRLRRLLGRLEVGVVRERRVAAHAEVVLHPALGGQAVVVPAHRVEDLEPAHAPVAGDGVGVRVAEHVAHVQRAGHGRRRRVDRIDARTRDAIGRTGRCRRGPRPPTTCPRGPRAPASPERSSRHLRSRFGIGPLAPGRSVVWGRCGGPSANRRPRLAARRAWSPARRATSAAPRRSRWRMPGLACSSTDIDPDGLAATVDRIAGPTAPTASRRPSPISSTPARPRRIVAPRRDPVRSPRHRGAQRPSKVAATIDDLTVEQLGRRPRRQRARRPRSSSRPRSPSSTHRTTPRSCSSRRSTPRSRHPRCVRSTPPPRARSTRWSAALAVELGPRRDPRQRRSTRDASPPTTTCRPRRVGLAGVSTRPSRSPRGDRGGGRVPRVRRRVVDHRRDPRRRRRHPRLEPGVGRLPRAAPPARRAQPEPTARGSSGSAVGLDGDERGVHLLEHHAAVDHAPHDVGAARAGRTSRRAAPLRGWPAARGRRCRASAPRRRRPRARRR